MKIHQKTLIRKVSKENRNKRKEEELPQKQFTYKTESSHKPKKEYSTRRRYYSETLKYLLDMYNKIWEKREIPKTWKHAIITNLVKRGKRPKC